MHTTAPGCIFRLRFWRGFRIWSRTEKQNGLSGLANGLRTVASLLPMCDPRDLVGQVGNLRRIGNHLV
ncbi:MAG TPA: hypothetical protein VIX89_09770 [Bryobacteraceae bacterium]